MTRSLSRRALTAGSLAGLLADRRSLTAQTPPSFTGQSIRVLAQSHPVTGYDDALRRLAETWAQQAGASVGIELCATDQFDTMLEGVLALNSLHDVVLARSPLVDMFDRFVDLGDLATTLQAQYGPPIQLADSAAVFDGKRGAICTGFVPAPMLFRRSLWETYRQPGGPPNWQSVLDIAPAMLKATGLYPGFGFAPEAGSERLTDSLIRAFGGSIVDQRGSVTLASDATADAIRFANDLWSAVMTPEAFSMKEDRPAGLLANNVASIINGSLNALRQATTTDRDHGADVYVVGPPGGPASTSLGSIAPVVLQSWHVNATSPVQTAAKSLISSIVAASNELVMASQLSEQPVYMSTVPSLMQEGGWLDNDPFGAEPVDKLRYMKSALAWTTTYGGGAFTHPRLAKAQRAFVLSGMMRAAIEGSATPEQAMEQAAQKIHSLA